MPTQITQLDDPERKVTTLRVQGEMTVADARLLERLGSDIRSESGNQILVDIADLYFIDSEAAPHLRRLKDREGFEIEGIEIFLQKAINEAERNHTPADD